MRRDYPRVYCDFNARVAENTYSLNRCGSVEDITRLGTQLCQGLKLTFWVDDAAHDGHDDDLLADGVVDLIEPWGWVARVDPETWRHVGAAGAFHLAYRKLNGDFFGPWLHHHV